MADAPHDSDTEGAPGARSGGGCLLVTTILLLAILAAAAALIWLRSHRETPNPALSGQPPSLPTH